MRWDAVARQRCEESVWVYLVECFFPIEQDGVKWLPCGLRSFNETADNVYRLGCRACCSEPILGFPEPVAQGCLKSGVDDLGEKFV